MIWEVIELGDSKTCDWELSIVNDCFPHGKASYGWYGEHKIPLWVPQPGSALITINENLISYFRGMAHELCKKLNEGFK